MTIPSTNIAVVDAAAVTRQVPAAAIPGGALAAGYVQVDPVTGHAMNTMLGGGSQYCGLTALGATLYTPSEANSSAAPIASGATFTGAWEAVPSQGYVSVNAYSSHPIQLTIQQAQDVDGSRPLPPLRFVFTAAFNQLIPVNGNYVRVTATNVGASVTTAFVLDCQYMSGGLPTTDRGAVAVGLTEPMGIMREAITDTLFVGRNSATPNTGVALNAAARVSYLATEGAITIRNTNNVGGADLHIRKLQLINVVAGTGLTALDALFTVDTTNRVSSGGTAMTMTSLASRRSPNASVLLGPVTLTAESGGTALQVGRVRLRTGIPVVGDIIKIAFGSEPTTEFGVVSGTAAAMFGHSTPAFIIPPGGTGIIYLWGAAQTAAPTFEVQLMMVER